MERQRENLSQQQKIDHLCQIFNIRENEAGRILKECQNSLEMAIAVLSSSIGGNGGFRGHDVAAPSHVTTEGERRLGDDVMSPIPVVDQATGTQHNPIDLTGDGDQDLQKALALSLQDMSHPSAGAAAISLEEQELSRALEASIADNNANMARMGMPMMSVFVDPLNPHERKRERDMPVGLKNIGNTCWFSAVIQSLFHIPRFCQLILSYHPPPLSTSSSTGGGDSEVQEQYPHCVVFVLELQKLFAFLHHSQRKYINPDLPIQCLKEAFTKGYHHTGAQQDVSEFTHKLLEWIEDAFKLSHGSEETNPIVELFNGHSKTEGVLNGQNFTNESRFGAFPVQVQGHTHLHDSLDATTYTAELNQETWFTRLPPILVLELSRFQFNQASGQAEKVHDMLRFDRRMCLDRYLDGNKEETRRRRIDVKKLREKLNNLEGRLASYLQYDQKPVSIIDTLTMTLKFVCQQGLVHGGGGGREEEREGGGGERAGKRPRTSLHPVPRFVSSSEIEVMENGLTRWIGELTQDVDELQESIGVTKATLDAVYGDPVMNATPYHLHAVLVHQGQASGGHYWAYIRRLYNPYLKRRHPRGGSGSHDQSCDATQQSHDMPGDVVLESQSELEGQGDENESERNRTTDITPQTGQSSGQGSPLDSQIDQTSVQDSQQTSQTGQPSSLGRTESVESASDMSETNQTPTVTNTNRTHKTVSTGSRSSEGMDVDRGGGVGVASSSSEVGGVVRGDEEVWLKFNDVSVSEVGWDEVQRESLGGGQSNTSAYCLIYVSEATHLQMKEGWRACVSEQLQRFVQKDNDVFSNEIAEFDERQKRILPAQHIGSSDELVVSGGIKGPTTSPTSGLAPASLASAAAPTDRHTRPGVLGAGIRQRTTDRSPEQMQVDSPILPPVDPQLTSELAASMEQLMKKINDLRCSGSFQEPRPLSIIAYVVLSKASFLVTKPLVLEAVSNVVANKEALQILARREYVRSLSESGVADALTRVRSSYQVFCCMCWHFVEAVKALRRERWGEGLAFSVHAYNYHTDIFRMTGSEDFSLQKRHLAILADLRRKALLGVSRAAYRLFEDNNVSEALKQANSLLVPGLGALAGNPCDGDTEVLEAVREEWCQYLTHPGLSEEDQAQLGDLLTRLFEDSSSPGGSSLPQPDIPDPIDNETLTLELSNALLQLMT